MHLLTLAFVLMSGPALVSAEEPTPDHVNLMKEIGGLNGKIRKGDDVAGNAKLLAAAGKKVESFWGKRSEVGMKSSQEMIAGANEMATAAAANNAEGIAAAGKKVGGSCRSCHDMHREKVAENVYKIK
jgi:Cytochrome C'